MSPLGGCRKVFTVQVSSVRPGCWRRETRVSLLPSSSSSRAPLRRDRLREHRAPSSRKPSTTAGRPHAACHRAGPGHLGGVHALLPGAVGAWTRPLLASWPEAWCRLGVISVRSRGWTQRTLTAFESEKGRALFGGCRRQLGTVGGWARTVSVRAFASGQPGGPPQQGQTLWKGESRHRPPLPSPGTRWAGAGGWRGEGCQEGPAGPTPPSERA